MKNNIEYYQHFCNSDQHPKFKMLRVKYGWEGEGKFWALNNRIGSSDNCRIDLNKKYNNASIANDLNFNLKEFDEFIEYLDNDCNLIIRENGFITTEIVIENLDKVMNKRKRNQTDYKNKITEDFRSIKNTEIEIKTPETIQSKVKENKLNKTKSIKGETKRFSPPPIENIEMYFNQLGWIGFNGKKASGIFNDFYTANGWMIGKNKMKDWKATVRNSRNWDKISILRNGKPVNRQRKIDITGMSINEVMKKKIQLTRDQIESLNSKDQGEYITWLTKN